MSWQPAPAAGATAAGPRVVLAHSSGSGQAVPDKLRNPRTRLGEVTDPTRKGAQPATLWESGLVAGLVASTHPQAYSWSPADNTRMQTPCLGPLGLQAAWNSVFSGKSKTVKPLSLW